MYQIDQATASASLPPPAALGTQGYFTNGNPGSGIPATIVDADYMNMLMMELMNIVTAGGGAASKTTYNNVLLAIENLIEVRSGNYALDTGAANAYVVALSPAISSYTTNLSGRFKVANANTGVSTLNMGAGAVALVNEIAGALQNGDLPAGAVVSYSYVLADNKAYITSLVPSQALSQTAADARYNLVPTLPTIDCTQAAGALTFISTTPFMAFRNASLTNGTPSVVGGAPANLVLPLAGSLGIPTTLSGRVVVAEMNNGGTRELAVCNIAGGLPMNEEGLISTTAIGSGSTANNVWYSTTARANLPYRIIAAFDVIWTTGGTGWSSPTTKIGAGGNALDALSSLGYGQTWQAVTRVSGTTYYNTTGKPIKLSVGVNSATSDGATTGITITVNGVIAAKTLIASGSTGAATCISCAEALIPVGGYYLWTQDAGASINYTSELR